MEVKKHELIEQQLCNALDEFENRLRQGQKMTSNDYDQVRIIYSALIKKKGYEGMLDYEDYEDELEGISGMRGRSPMTGRYVSRENRASFDDGYAQGYSEAMSRMDGGNSGHYPPMYPPRMNRW